MTSFEVLDFTNVQWEALDQFQDRSVFQTKAWLEFIKESQSAYPIIVAIKESNEVLGYFSGLIVRKLGVKILGSPFSGWTTTYMGFNLYPGTKITKIMEEFSTFAFKTLGCRVIQISERRLSDLDFNNTSFSVINYRNLEIDLTKTLEELFHAMTPAKRRNIKKAEKSHIIVEEASDSGFAEDYYAQLIEVFGKKSLKPTYDIERVKSLIKHVHPSGNLLLLRARKPDNGRCIATAIFPAFNDTMIFWGGASWREFQYLRPNEYLMWYAMKYWKARGIKTFNLGGWADYKKQYGGEQIKDVILMKTNPKFLAGFHSNTRNLWQLYRKVSGGLLNSSKKSHEKIE